MQLKYLSQLSSRKVENTFLDDSTDEFCVTLI